MVTHEAKNDTVVMLDGSVAARQALYNHGTLPNGVNFTTIYEIYNISGQIPWGPRVVNITYVITSSCLCRPYTTS